MMNDFRVGDEVIDKTDMIDDLLVITSIDRQRGTVGCVVAGYSHVYELNLEDIEIV